MATSQEITAAVHEAERRILPARLADVPSNSFSIMAHVVAKGHDPASPDSYIAAFKALYNRLEWAVKPAKLLADERNDENKPATLENVRVSEKKRTEVVRAGEKADADAKKHAALVKQCEEIIAGYNPTKLTRNGSVYDARERQEMQALWIKELHKAKEKSVEYMRGYTKSLAATVAKRYADRERASERL